MAKLHKATLHMAERPDLGQPQRSDKALVGAWESKEA